MVRTVRCWAKTHNAYMFSLRKVIQVIFSDGSQLLLEKSGGLATMVEGRSFTQWKHPPTDISPRLQLKVTILDNFLKALINRQIIGIRKKY